MLIIACWLRHCLQIGVILIRKRHLGSILHLLLVLLKKSGIDSCGWWSKSRCSNEFQSWVANELSCQPEEGLLKVIVGLGGDIVVLKILLAMECDGLGLDFSLLDINLVSSENDWNVLADTD